MFFIPTLQAGGSERVAATIAKHVDRSRYSLTFCVLDLTDEVFLQEIPEDISVVCLEAPRVRQALFKIIRLIHEHKPDVVMSMLAHLNIALAMLRVFLPRNTQFVARESSIVSQNILDLPFPPLWRIAYRLFLPNFDTVVCQSKFMFEDLCFEHGFPVEKAKVIYNPVDTQNIRELAKATLPIEREAACDLQILAVGRLSPEKGFDLLLQALSETKHEAAQLWLIGDGPQRNELELFAVRLGIADRVKFLGQQKNPFPFYLHADVFVLSSRFEGLPNVVLEALACGTPVISTPAIGGVSEVLAEVPGTIVTRSVDADSLRVALDDFSPGFRLSENASQRFDVGKIVSTYEDLFACE